MGPNVRGNGRPAPTVPTEGLPQAVPLTEGLGVSARSERT
jgi:hypothetical protein